MRDFERRTRTFAAFVRPAMIRINAWAPYTLCSMP